MLPQPTISQNLWGGGGGAWGHEATETGLAYAPGRLGGGGAYKDRARPPPSPLRIILSNCLGHQRKAKYSDSVEKLNPRSVGGSQLMTGTPLPPVVVLGTRVRGISNSSRLYFHILV